MTAWLSSWCFEGTATSDPVTFTLTTGQAMTAGVPYTISNNNGV